MKKLFRISTVPSSLNVLLKGQLQYLDQYFDVTAVSGDGPDLEEVAQREGVKTHALEMQRQISPVKDLVSLIKLYFYFKKEKPDIIHSMTPKAGLLSMIAGKLAGVPVRIHTFTGLIFPNKRGFMQKILILMDKLLCACATNVNPEGEGVRNDLQNYKITKKPLEIIANGNVNGVDLKYFDHEIFSSKEKENFRKELNIEEDDFVFLFVGRLVTDKGINELTQAFVDINCKFPNTKLLLVGPFEEELDPLLPEVKKEINQNSNIISVGFQKDVRPYFAIANVFVFPSHREGFPNVLLQAGAMGLYSIVTNISGSNEIVKNGINGQIIAVNHKNELGLVLENILPKKQELAMSENVCRSLIEENYDQYYVWDCLKNKYYSLVDNN